MTLQAKYLVAGAVSGAAWCGIAVMLDSNWAMVPGMNLPFVAALLAAMITGLVISLVFRGPFLRATTGKFLLLPLLTLPMGIAVFALLLWAARQLTGVRFAELSPHGELRLILETFLIGGLISIFTPILLLLALLNQWVMRNVLRRPS